MQIKTFLYKKSTGWSIEKFPALDSENTLVLVFAAPEFLDNPEPIDFLAKQYPNSKIIGCSSAGEIIGESINDHSLSVAVAKFEHTQLQVSIAHTKTAKESYETGASIAKELAADDLAGIFVLSEGLKINGSELVKGLNSATRKNTIITGGLAGDGADFKKTWLVKDGKIYSEAAAVVAVGFYGDAIQIGHGSKGGWDIFGLERRITRAKHNVLYELDGQSALSLYKEYLGEKAKDLPASGLLYPLSIRKNSEDDKYLVRTILAVDDEAGSLTFAGDMPVGYMAQLMRANFDRLVTGAEEAGELVLQSKKGHKKSDAPTLLVAISCVGRRLLLGERTEEEVSIVLEKFPKGTEMVGFYSYGELSPYATGDCDLHNQTMTLTAFSESE